MAFDLPLTVYARLREILENDGDFATAFRVGNRRWQNVQDAAFPEKIRKDIGDFPEFLLGMDEPDWLRGPPKFFVGLTDQPDYPIPCRLSFPFRIIHDKTNLSQQSNVEATVIGPIVRAAPRLGLTAGGDNYIQDVTVQAVKRSDENNADTGKVQRTVARGRIIVNAFPYRSLFT